MTNATSSPSDRQEDPSDAVWQEYPVSLFGDVLQAVTVLLSSVALGSGLAILIDLGVQIGFAAVLGQWIPADDVEALGIAALLVAPLTAALAAAAPMIPGLLAARRLQKSLLTAVSERAPATRVPHPVQQNGGYRGSMGTLISVLLGIVAGIYLLVRIIIDPGRSEYWFYGAIVLGYALLGAAVHVLLGAAERRDVAQLPRPKGKKKKKKRTTPFHLYRAHWSKAYRGAVWSKAARAAGFESIGDARRAVKRAEAEETRKKQSRVRPPQLGGGGPPLPTKPDAKGPEWVYRDQPPGMWSAIRTRWGAQLAAWAAFVGAAFLGQALFGDDDAARQDLGPETIAVGVLAGVAVVAILVALLAEVVLSVIRTRERAQLFAAAADPGSPRPAEGALVRGSAPRRLGLTRAGALLVGVALPFVIVAKEATGDEGSYFAGHAGAVDLALWACIALFAGCALVQAIEYHYGRSARSRVMARWPSLWHERDLTGW